MVATRSARRATPNPKAKPISRAKVVFAVLAAVAFQLLLTSLDLPLLKVGRNILSKSTPDPLPPKYACDDLSQKLTVVVTVKDACSQMPGFVKALEPVVGTQTSLILTYPALTACDPLALKVDLAPWRDVTTVPLPPSASPMRGWSDSVGLIKTEFALLLRRLPASDLWVAAMAWGPCAIDPNSSPRRDERYLRYRRVARIIEGRVASKSHRRNRETNSPRARRQRRLRPRPALRLRIGWGARSARRDVRRRRADALRVQG